MKPHLFLALAGGLSAQLTAGEPRAEREHKLEATTRPPDRGWWKRHLADSAFHLAGTSLDAASSWGQPELHPLLRNSRGEFGGRGLAVKLGVFGGVEVVKWKLARRHGKTARALSLVPAAMYGGVAVRNWRAR